MSRELVNKFLVWENRNIYIVAIVSYIMEKTTIQLNVNTLERMKILKNFERQSYDDVLNILIDNYEDGEVLTEQELEEIKRGLEQIRQGKITPIEQVAREMGIALK
jgi:hypothetical protein